MKWLVTALLLGIYLAVSTVQFHDEVALEAERKALASHR